MSIARYKPSTQPNVQPTLPKTQPDHYKGVVNDDKYQSLHSLTAYVEGYPLTVDYYGQILGENNDVREIDPSQSGVYQQYLKVIKLDIRASDPLGFNYDDDSGLSTVNGSANIYPGLVPNTYDYFVAKITRGRKGLFRITNVSRMSMNRDSVHKIDYQLIGYIDQGDAKIYFDNLESKVKKKYYFHGDRLVEGASPLLKEEDSYNIDELFRNYHRIVQYYFHTFYNKTYQTLVIPGQEYSIYDKFLTDYLIKIVSIKDAEEIVYTKQLGSDRDRYMLQPNFWSSIYERNPIYIAQSNKFMGLTDRINFYHDNYVAGAGLSTIDKYVYPTEVDESTKLPADPNTLMAGPGLIDTPGPNGTQPFDDNNIYYFGDEQVPIYKKVLYDNYYVLSSDFYNQTDNQSLLEKVTWNYLDSEAINLNELSALTKKYYNLPRLEQFYYGPLLLTFIKDTKFAQYT